MKEISNKKRKKKGFTLIELIIVIAIIAIIGAIALPNFTKIRTESKVKADNQSRETIKRITETLLVEDKVLPGDTITITFSGSGDTATKEVKKGTTASDELAEYFKDVKKPQEDGKTGYSITTQTTTGTGSTAKTTTEVKVVTTTTTTTTTP